MTAFFLLKFKNILYQLDYYSLKNLVTFAINKYDIYFLKIVTKCLSCATNYSFIFCTHH